MSSRPQDWGEFRFVRKNVTAATAMLAVAEITATRIGVSILEKLHLFAVDVNFEG